ncbi:MAG: DNA polymerase III subunit delta' [Mariprofundaceae bacterium]
MNNKVIGHEVVEQRFLEAMQSSRLHHAWLLYGQKGIGKSAIAKQMAAAYLCEHNREGDVQAGCGECHGCAMLAADSHPDFIYTAREEGKRDLPVSRIRETLDFLSLSGMESQRRIVLLDDAETMNIQAANALLKGLEEPSQGSLLLIVCHDLMHLPATIRSRCMLEHCSPLNEQNMQQVLDDMGLGEETSELAFSLATGRPGHVACLQDQALADALLKWHRLVQDLGKADVGKIQDWLVKNITLVPHHLIVDTILYPLQQQLHQSKDFAKGQSLLDATWALAAWPGDVIRHTLRAAPTLLTRLLQLRSALRSS